MILKDGWKLMRPHSSGNNVKMALYDLNTDPNEINNLLAESPGNYKNKVSELEACFDEWSKKTGSGK
jgi:hypothetical protein